MLQKNYLGLILFCKFLNYIGNILIEEFSRFSDDSKIFRYIKNDGNRYTLQKNIKNCVDSVN